MFGQYKINHYLCSVNIKVYNMVFYRFLFKHMDMLTINEKLIYSSLISYSVKMSKYLFEDGQLDSEYLHNYLDLHSNEHGYARLPLIMPALKEMAREMDIARNTLKKALNKFKEIRLITNEGIVCHKELFNSGYMELPNISKVKGQLLLFYTFLEYRSRFFNGTLDTYTYKLAELTGFSEKSVSNMLHRLHACGLVERLSDGKLKVKPIDIKKEETSQLPPECQLKVCI